MNKDPRNNQAGVVLFVIAGLLLLTIVSHSWFSSPDGGVSLFGIQRCFEHRCESMLWFGMHGAPALIVLLALLGIAASFGAIAMLVHTAIMFTRGTPHAVKLHRARIALVSALVAALLFMMRIVVSEPRMLATVGWSAIVFLLAVAAGLVVLSKLVAPLVVAPVAMTFAPPPPMLTGPSDQPIPAFPLTLQNGMNRMHGHVFLAQGRLYFVCVKTGGAWAHAIGAGLGGMVGGALASLAQPTVDGAPVIYDEAQLHQAVSTMPGSIVMEARNIEQIKETWAWRLIRANGKKYGLPKGLGYGLKAALGPWARYYQVRTVGFA